LANRYFVNSDEADHLADIANLKLTFMWRSRVIIAVCVVGSFFILATQEPLPKKYGDKIVAADLKEYLTILASDAMEGRETGKRGQKMAAAFIRAHFEDLGLTGPIGGNYYQPMEFYTTAPGETYLASGKNRFMNLEKVIYSGGDTNGEVAMPLVFAGNGEETDLNMVDVKDKAVLLLATKNWTAGNSAIGLARQRGARLVLVCDLRTKDFEGLVNLTRRMHDDQNLSATKPVLNQFPRPGLFYVSPDIVQKLIGVELAVLEKAAQEEPKKKALKKIKPSMFSYKASTDIKIVKTENVLGLLEGTDKKDELLIISAHFDHVGVSPSGEGDVIYNGADDDGSGTVAVMELAKVFAEAKKAGHGPRRSILFMAFTGEENGLLGSDFYAKHPTFPLLNTVANLNIDMIGRRDAKHTESPPYVYVIGADKLSSTLNTVSETANKNFTNLVFDYTYNDLAHPENLYYRSDHWNFAKRNIPIIFYFDGIHEDYHQPGDEVEKIEFDLLAKRTQCIFYTAWEIVNRDVRITPDKN
jgi:hypothetical protein